MTTKRWVVFIIESERGWGQRVDEKKFFESLDEATKFVTEFNSANDKPTVPDWYMYATDPERVVER
jgi:hypothetical protein